ncbi:hypothetical protein [Streptomyces sp. NPDC085540]|uniref:hypothetical protein n=1 Tax=Streptomyces sp. NPDC085540 TaxID=3365730 RepID=UPI0037D75C8D
MSSFAVGAVDAVDDEVGGPCRVAEGHDTRSAEGFDTGPGLGRREAPLPAELSAVSLRSASVDPRTDRATAASAPVGVAGRQLRQRIVSWCEHFDQQVCGCSQSS